MMDDEDIGDLSEKLKMMRLYDFIEARELKIKIKTFMAIYQEKIKKPRKHHELILCFKVFQAFMIDSMQLRDFQQRLSDIYVKILRQKHFQCIKQFKEISQSERNNRIKAVEKLRKSICMNKFKSIMQNKIIKKLQQKSRFTKIVNEYSKTQNQFYLPKQIDNSYLQNVTHNNFSRNLEDSRKSGQSIYSAFDSQSRRKFVPIKQVPKLPELRSVKQVIIQNQSGTSFKSQLNQQKQKIKTEIIQKESNAKQISTKQNNEQSQKQLSKETIQNTVPRSKDQKLQQLKKPKTIEKDKILSILCQIKIAEVTQLTDIIKEYQQNLKNQSVLNERGYINQSLKILQSIMLIE